MIPNPALMATRDHTSVVIALVMAGYRSPVVADGAYAPPRSDWLTGDFYAWFRSALFSLGATSYKPEAWDCDDYADLFSALARICHRRTAPDSGTALPVGVVHFRQKSGGGHAVVVALTSDRGLIHIEPQTGEIITVTEAEAASAWLVKL